VFNRREYMDECLQAVMGQSFGDFEYVIGDNASFDGTSELIDRYAAMDPRIRVVRHDRNVGMIENSNRIYSELRGDYAIMVCSDDLLLPGALGQFVEALDVYPGAVMATSSTAWIGPSGIPLPHQPPSYSLELNGEPTLLEGTALARLMVAQYTNYIGNPPLFRRSLVSLERWCAINARIPAAGDMALYVSLLAEGPVLYSPQPLRAYRSHPDQYTKSDQLCLEHVIAISQLTDVAHEVGVLPDQETEMRASLHLLSTAIAQISALRNADRLLESDVLGDLTTRMARACTDVGRLAPAP
jgi:glycosyltransferase involved in cell wall biosynthesis